MMIRYIFMIKWLEIFTGKDILKLYIIYRVNAVLALLGIDWEDPIVNYELNRRGQIFNIRNIYDKFCLAPSQKIQNLQNVSWLEWNYS